MPNSNSNDPNDPNSTKNPKEANNPKDLKFKFICLYSTF